MTTNGTTSLLSRMESVLTDAGFQNELAQIRSRAVLHAIGTTQPSPRWTYVAPRFSRNSAAALYALEAAALDNLDSVLDRQRYSRQIALAWESLAKLSEGTTRPTALLNAALAYELAGFQANSAYLAKEVLPDDPRFDSRANALSLVASFLQRRLIATSRLAEFLTKNPIDPSLPLADLSVAMGEVLLGDGLSKASLYFLSGNQEAYDESLKLLEEAGTLFDRLGTPIQSHIAFGVRAVIPKMKRQSTWSQLKLLTKESGVWKRYLTLLARGPAGPSSRGATELWPSQIRVLENNLLGSDGSAIIRLPTSGGKTRIAEMAIIDTLVRNANAKCVFVAPYRALAFELEKSLGEILNDLGYRVSSVVGSYESDEFEGFLLNAADLLIVTPEKLDLLLRLYPDLADQIKLVVLDEMHMIDDAGRGVKFEILLSRLKARFPNCRFLVMSAVIPDSSVRNFAAWLADSPTRTMSSDWRPTIQRIARFEWRGNQGVIRFEHDKEIPRLNSFVPGVIQRQPYPYRHPDTGRTRKPVFPSTDKGDAAAELAYAFSEQGPVLVFCTQRNWAESICRKILEQSIGLRRIVGKSIHPHFSTMEPTRSLILSREWLGEDHIASKALEQGIALHHGRLPSIVREAIEVDCRAGKYKVIVATNTLAQGVNLPVRTVIIHSTWRHDGGGERSRIPVRDYFNVAGRAGRAGQETEGLVVHLTLNEQDKRDFQFFTDRNNIEPVQGALFQLLHQIALPLLPSVSLEEAAATLDPEILAIAVEEGIEAANSDRWSISLKGTFATLQADEDGISTEPLLDSIYLAAEEIFRLAPERAWRKVYAQTGLKSSSCSALRTFVNVHANELRECLLQTDFDSVDRLNHLALEASLQLPEAVTNVDITGDPEELLRLWLEGRPIDEIARVLDATDSLEDLSRYVEELFGYLLPWIVSGFIRISKETLSIQEKELSEHIRSYPSMVKYGLPDPVAAWAMSAGIGSRNTALRLAGAFNLSNSQTHSHEKFIDWMASLSDELLHNDFAVTGNELETLRYKIDRMALNPFLRPIKPLKELLPIETKVAGVRFESRRYRACRIRKGEELELRRDYDNPVDLNAVAVYGKTGQIGFLERFLAQRIAPDIDAGTAVLAKTVDITREKVPVVTAELSLN